MNILEVQEIVDAMKVEIGVDPIPLAVADAPASGAE